jgi:hypothetical protein
MNRKRLLLVAVILLLASSLAVWWFAPSEVPPGQPPLATLDAASLEAVRADFNRHASQVRVIVLLSPT